MREARNAYRILILVGKPDRKRSLGRYKGDEMDLRKTGCGDVTV
jgi:hypothetical protein